MSEDYSAILKCFRISLCETLLSLSKTMICVEPGEKLALARKYNSPALSQKELAQILKVDTSTVGRWESKNEIPPERLPVIASLLNVREEWFYDGGDAPPSAARRSPGDMLTEARSTIYGVPKEQQTRVETKMASGIQVAVPIWRGVAAGSTEECEFVESDTPEFREVPMFFTADSQNYVLCIASGQSMSTRIEHGDRILVRLDPDVPTGRLVVARSPEGRNYIKKLVGAQRRLELHSINPDFTPITEIDGWQIKGGAIVIWHDYEAGKPNLEWDEGRYLRA